VDEILAVGDEKFQKKCYAKMEEFKKSGKTIVLVSHSIDKIKSFCDRALYIKYGVQEAMGEVEMVTKKYVEDQQ
jgi:ABC-type polysaccharide/polyol phosphate transport system ATPase subunit